jgi:hypothetical protein
MTVTLCIPEQDWTAERFLETDQHEFGDASAASSPTPHRRPSTVPSWPG